MLVEQNFRKMIEHDHKASGSNSLEVINHIARLNLGPRRSTWRLLAAFLPRTMRCARFGKAASVQLMTAAFECRIWMMLCGSSTL